MKIIQDGHMMILKRNSSSTTTTMRLQSQKGAPFQVISYSLLALHDSAVNKKTDIKQVTTIFEVDDNVCVMSINEDRTSAPQSS